MTDDEVKDFVAISFSEYSKSTRERLYSKVNKEQNFRKVAKSPYIFLITSDEVEKSAKMMQSSSPDNCAYHYNVGILYPFDPELQLINTNQ